MNQDEKRNTVKALAVAYKLCSGSELTDDETEGYLLVLSEHDYRGVQTALRRCIAEVKGRLAPADIISRIPSEWPTADEAWALCPKSEAETAVWINEISDAYFSVQNLSDDRVAMRMAFKNFYERGVSEAKARGQKPLWFPSLGTDRQGREPVLRAAIEKGRISAAQAQQLLPDITENTVPLLPPSEDLPIVDKTMAALARAAREFIGKNWTSEHIEARVKEILEDLDATR